MPCQRSFISAENWGSAAEGNCEVCGSVPGSGAVVVVVVVDDVVVVEVVGGAPVVVDTDDADS
jgi:hypothetical protein